MRRSAQAGHCRLGPKQVPGFHKGVRLGPEAEGHQSQLPQVLRQNITLSQVVTSSHSVLSARQVYTYKPVRIPKCVHDVEVLPTLPMAGFEIPVMM
jgi:hypothetical protein